MGQCISKHPSTLQLDKSHKDLSSNNKICCEFCDNICEYAALNHEPGNQLDDDDGNNVCFVEGNVTEQLKKFQFDTNKAQENNLKYHVHNIQYPTTTTTTATTISQSLNNVTLTKAATTEVLKVDIIKQHLDVRSKTFKEFEKNQENPIKYNNKENDFDDDDDGNQLKLNKKLWSLSSKNNNNNNHNKKYNNCHINQQYEGAVENNIKSGEEQAEVEEYDVKSRQNLDTKAFESNNDNNNNNQKELMGNQIKQLYQMSKFPKHNEYEYEVKRHKQVTENFILYKKSIQQHKPDTPLESPLIFIEGQAESKRNAKKHGAVGDGGTVCVVTGAGTLETKGTAMSFGFRKKLNTTPKKLKKFIEGDVSKKKHLQQQQQQQQQQVDGKNSNINYAETATNKKVTTSQAQDSNGNLEQQQMNAVNFMKVSATAAVRAASSPANTEHHHHEYQAREASRFGFRGGNVPRPASTGLTSRYSKMEGYENIENNNCIIERPSPGGLVSNLKRRSKSAHVSHTSASTATESDSKCTKEQGVKAGTPKINQPKSITFNLNQNSTIEYQRQQFFQQPTAHLNAHSSEPIAAFAVQPQLAQYTRPNFVNTGMHTNVIVRPTPQAQSVTSYSKFTLQTVNLPKPEFAVPISVNASTPTTSGNTYFSSVASTNSRPSHPLTMVHTQHQYMDSKQAKQLVNSTRRGFSGSREISADSGISCMDIAMDNKSHGSPKRSRSRPRNLQMVMNGRHKFEVRDIVDPLSSGSSVVEPLTLPKLPMDSQTTPLPLNGLVRSNTVMNREANERACTNSLLVNLERNKATRSEFFRNSSEETDSYNEEKLHLDRFASENQSKFRDINTNSSKNSSPGSAINSSWSNAGESLAMKDCSSLSISSSSGEVINCKSRNEVKSDYNKLELQTTSTTQDDDLSIMSSIAEQIFKEKCTALNEKEKEKDSKEKEKPDYPKTLFNEQKFAEMALAGSAYLLDDETSPTDSLVSSTESEEAATKQKKHRMNEQLQEKDIDEISPELEVCSPISPGTPTHASHSLSLSDCGNLIDDEIADQPALLFNNDSSLHLDDDNENACGDSFGDGKEKTDTPTLMETASCGSSLRKKSKALNALQQAIELSLRTPLSLHKTGMHRTESLDTLSPCESICSEDLMMDFEMSSSMDSVDRNASMKSRSGSDINKLEDINFDMQMKSSNILKDLNNLSCSQSSRRSERENILSRLPARATRLLNRSRLTQQYHNSSNKSLNASIKSCLSNNNSFAIDSDSSPSVRSVGSLKRQRERERDWDREQSSRASPASVSVSSARILQQKHNFQLQKQHSKVQRERERNASQTSLDDLMLYDKSFRNAMIQDVLHFKKQLLRLRRILQEAETINPFESDNDIGLNGKLLNDLDLDYLNSSTSGDSLQELSDLRRQVVYLQSEVEDRERTIRLQENRIKELEVDQVKPQVTSKTCINSATQTERARIYHVGPEALSRSKPEFTSYTTTHINGYGNETDIFATSTNTNDSNNKYNENVKNQCLNNLNGSPYVLSGPSPQNHARRHTIISTTLTKYNHKFLEQASMAYKSQNNRNNNNEQNSFNNNNHKNVIHSNRYSTIMWEKPIPSNIIMNSNATITTTSPTKTTTTTTTPSVYKPVKITLIGEPLKQWTSANNINDGANNRLNLAPVGLTPNTTTTTTTTNNGCLQTESNILNRKSKNNRELKEKSEKNNLPNSSYNNNNNNNKTTNIVTCPLNATVTIV